MSDLRGGSAIAPASLPNFIIIGAAKAGTTSLYEYMRSHPQVFMPRKKEPEFFSSPNEWERGVERYSALFRNSSGAKAVGEASTSYTKYPQFPGVPERIASVLPDVRLIYVLRHPIERMRSQYLFRSSKGWERRPIDEALLADHLYLDVSRYAMQLDRYLRCFPRSQILVVHAEALRSDRAATTRLAYEFVGVDASWNAPLLQHEYNTRDSNQMMRGAVLGRSLLRQSGAYRRLVRTLPTSLKMAAVRPFTAPPDEHMTRLSSSARERLEHLLRDDVMKMREYLGDDFDGWGIA